MTISQGGLKDNQARSYLKETPAEEGKNSLLNTKCYVSSGKSLIGEGNISQLHAFCRDDLFKRIKMISSQQLEADGDIMKVCLAKIHYDSSNGVKQGLVNAIRTEIRNTINSRRGYVKRQIGITMTGMLALLHILFYIMFLTLLLCKDLMKSNDLEMFDVNMMKYFYNPEYIDNVQVKNAWYIYVYRMLPMVNKRWRDNISSERIKNQELLFKSISISDEALVQWLIILWYPVLEKRKIGGWQNESKSTGKGPHYTKQNKNIYIMFHNNIEKSRIDVQNAVIWNNLFWEQLRTKHIELFTEKKDNRFSSKSLYDNVEFCLPGMNEENDFLLMFNAAEAITMSSPSKQASFNEIEQMPCTNSQQMPDFVSSFYKPDSMVADAKNIQGI